MNFLLKDMVMFPEPCGFVSSVRMSIEQAVDHANFLGNRATARNKGLRGAYAILQSRNISPVRGSKIP
jgi:hypothetical protein